MRSTGRRHILAATGALVRGCSQAVARALWRKAERRHDPDSIEGRLFGGLRKLIEARHTHPHTHNFGLLHPLWSGNVHALAIARRRHDGHLLVLANLSEHPQSVQGDLPLEAGLSGALTDLLGSDPMADPSGRIPLQPYGLRWLVGEGKL